MAYKMKSGTILIIIITVLLDLLLDLDNFLW